MRGFAVLATILAALLAALFWAAGARAEDTAAAAPPRCLSLGVR